MGLDCLPADLSAEASAQAGGAVGWEAARPCAVPRGELCSTTGVSKEAKPAKFLSIF